MLETRQPVRDTEDFQKAWLKTRARVSSLVKQKKHCLQLRQRDNKLLFGYVIWLNFGERGESITLKQNLFSLFFLSPICF